MLRNNADARRCSYFEFGLPVLGDGGRVGLENCADPGFFFSRDGRGALGTTEGNLRFEIDWGSLIVGSKCTVLALFYFVF